MIRIAICMHDRTFERSARINRKRTILRTGSYPDRVSQLVKKVASNISCSCILFTLGKTLNLYHISKVHLLHYYTYTHTCNISLIK